MLSVLLFDDVLVQELSAQRYVHLPLGSTYYNRIPFGLSHEVTSFDNDLDLRFWCERTRLNVSDDLRFFNEVGSDGDVTMTGSP